MVSALVLFGATVWLFWPAASFDYINFDDPQYVSANPYVRQGLTAISARWAFTSVHESYWIPLTWLSYMVDASLLGPKAGSYHVTNIILHALNAVLLFLVLSRMTRRWWPSLFVAALFAWHPLRVESVAWITERKDVLSALFWLLGMGLYDRYVRRQSVTRFLPVFLCMLLGLLAKPMMVTFPFVLLLLDYWPLNRAGDTAQEAVRRLPRLLLEKAPLFVLAVVFGVITMRTQAADDAVKSLAQIPLATRLADVSVAYLFYVGKLIWPTNLAIVYSDLLARWPVAILSWLTLLGVTWMALGWRRRIPAFPVGWFWFLGVLVPVIGFVRVGTVHVADRFTYIPSIGVAVALTWVSATFVKDRRRVGMLISALLLILCMGATRKYLCYWANTEQIFQRALDINPVNPIAFEGMGRAMEDRGRYKEALGWYEKTIAIMPAYGEAYANAGSIHGKLGEFDKSLACFEMAQKYRPNNPRILNNLGSILYKAGRQDEAIQTLARAVQLKPDLIDAQYNLALAYLKSGRNEDALLRFQDVLRLCNWDADAFFLVGKLLLMKGDIDGALRHLQEAVRLAPSNPDALNMYGAALAKSGDYDGAARVLRDAVRLQANNVEVLNNLAWLLATREGCDASEAIRLAERAAELTARQQPHILDTLAAAYAADGQFDMALSTMNEAVALATPLNRPELMSRLESRRLRYQAGQPWRE